MEGELDLDALEVLAKEATPGPWHWVRSDDDMVIDWSDPQDEDWRCSLRTVAEHPGSYLSAPFPDFVLTYVEGDMNDRLAQDATLIATANPSTVLTLIAEARKAVTYREALGEATELLAEVFEEFGPGCRDFSTWDTVEAFLDRVRLDADTFLAHPESTEP